MSQPLQPLNFVVDTLISQGLHILAGSPKVGKSWLALWLTVTVAKGEPVWGMRVKRGTTAISGAVRGTCVLSPWLGSVCTLGTRGVALRRETHPWVGQASYPAIHRAHSPGQSPGTSGP